MVKTTNDPSTYRKRADFAKSVASDGKAAPKPLPEEKRALLVSSFGKAGDRKAGYVPFRKIVGK